DAIYPNHVVSVYNRLGNKIYESIQGGYNQMPWDGTFNGESLPVASYYFIIEYNDNSTPNSNGIITIVK
ncbi:MAG: gliding motility-associated C-terminal domain-containing protein, partial [Crocinitomicaceae bacterium]|nr:gliding motility-associated C-terminal domain-containing protein [Crocinitomicaceae bacterium]